MTHPRPSRLPVAAPTVAAPPAFVERRVTFRRAVDRLAHEETGLLARSLDVLAAGGGAEARLAGLLDLLATTVGATRAAVVSDGPERRVAVAADDDADMPAAMDLARWLDVAAPRSRARRAASAPAPVSVAFRTAPTRSRTADRRADDPHYAALPIPSAGEVTLGFAFAEPVASDALDQALPPAMARHAAVALTLVTESLATERALAMLTAGEAERERFVSTVAHELRTPLTGLSGYLDLILDGRVDDREVEREFLERGRTIVASMAGLVGDLLELSKLESGSLSLDIAPFSLAEALGTVQAALLPIALERGLDLRTVPPPRLRAALGDRRRVEQVVTNLAANALKFGGPAGRVVELAAWFDGAVAVVAIRDEGEGIDAEDRPRIFERFYRMVGHERVTGTGLGLPIARDLARAMAGDLDVASRPGAGSSFVLVLPGPGTAPAAETIAAVLATSLAAETERLRTVALLRAADPSVAAGAPVESAPAAAASAPTSTGTSTKTAADPPRPNRLRLSPTAPSR